MKILGVDPELMTPSAVAFPFESTYGLGSDKVM